MICLASVSLEFANCPVVNFFWACCGQNCERPWSRHDNVVCFCLVFDISGFFETVFRALREKTGVTDDQFTKYLEVLLGNKDHEEVLESIAKVDKAMRISSPPASRRFSYYRGTGRVNRSSVQCYYCYQFDHYQIPAHSVCHGGLVLVLHLREADSPSNLKSSLPCLSLFNNSERVVIKNNSLFYFGRCVYLCGFPCCPGRGGRGARTFSRIWVSNPRWHTAFLGSRRTFCYQSFEVALSWSGTPSIFSHLGYFCSHITSPAFPLFLDQSINFI